MEKLLEVFDLKDLASAVRVIKKLEAGGKTLEEFKAYVAKRREGEILASQKGRIINPCPKCGALLNLFTVNRRKGDQVGGKFKTQWRCLKCEYERFSKNTVQEEVDKLRRLQNGTR